MFIDQNRMGNVNSAHICLHPTGCVCGFLKTLTTDGHGQNLYPFDLIDKHKW